MYTVLIKDGMVADGAGTPLKRADVAIQKDRIAAVAPGLADTAQTVIDAAGLVVAPGFIDIHTHTDGTVFRYPLAESKIRQGVTTEVTGNCGIGCFPVARERADILLDYLRVHEFDLPPEGLAWIGFAEYSARVAKARPAVNHVPLLAHGALRIAVMGADDRLPTAQEQAAMEEILDRELAAGAWGMSSGLIYPPGSYAATAELVGLAKVLARHGALYTSHIRGESATLLEALEEAVTIGRESGARVEVSHLKAMGKAFWGKGQEALRRIEAARREGVDITADQYPYEASSTSLATLVPPWAHAGGVGEMLKKLADPAYAGKVREGIGQEMAVRGGPERVMIAGVGSERNAGLSGKTMAQIASLWGLTAEEAVIRLLLEEDGKVGAVYFSIAEADMLAILASPYVAVGSDGRGLKAGAAAGATHPRSYGTFARVLGRYAREQGVLSLEQAIYKMTGLSASRLGLPDRGFLRPGAFADVVVFDPAKVNDAATFEAPHQYATGVEHVLVNGRFVVRDGAVTGDAPGRVLQRGPGGLAI